MRLSLMRSATAFTTHTSFSDLAHRYDGFILDQFGVMHNGKHSLPGAIECVNELSSLGKKLIILSNTSSPSSSAIARLPDLGFDVNHFVGAVTSGEEASRFIKETYGQNSEETKKKGLWFTWTRKAPNPLDFIAKCGNIDVTDNVEEADFVIIHGSQILRSSGSGKDGEEASIQSLGSFMKDGSLAEVIDPILERCRERNLPMVCANPDFVVMMPDGSTGHMPGKIAKRYEELGGQCTTFGKPHAPHFEACIRELGLDRNRVAHVGDSLHHDVAGANAAGIASVFVTGGIHNEELGRPVGELPEYDALQMLFEKESHTPTHVVPMFKIA